MKFFKKKKRKKNKNKGKKTLSGLGLSQVSNLSQAPTNVCKHNETSTLFRLKSRSKHRTKDFKTNVYERERKRERES